MFTWSTPWGTKNPNLWWKPPETEGNVMGLFKPTNLSSVLQKNIFVPNMKKYYDLERADKCRTLKKKTLKRLGVSIGAQGFGSEFYHISLVLTNYKVILVMPCIQRACCKVNLLISALQLHKEDEPLFLYLKPSKTLKIITCVILNIKQFCLEKFFFFRGHTRSGTKLLVKHPDTKGGVRNLLSSIRREPGGQK